MIVAGDVALTEDELFAHVENIPPEDRAGFVSGPKRIADAAQKRMLEEQLAQAGIQSGLLEDKIFTAGLYSMVMKEVAKRQLKRVVAERKLDSYERQGRELYLANPERFQSEPTYTFTHLLISTRERSESEAMREILALQDRVEAGEDLDALVKAHSEDGTLEENDGQYESVSPARLDSNFARALRELEEGENVSGPVRSQFGWHLIRLDEIHSDALPSWEEARSQAVQLAEQRHEETIRKNYMQEVKGAEEIDLVPDLVDRIQRRYGVSGDGKLGN